MRQAISGAWLYSIIIVFTLFMVAFVSITLNYHNVFKMKTEIVTALEQYSGLTPESEKRIKGIISKHGYTIRKRCVTPEELNGNGDKHYFSNYFGIISGREILRNPTEDVEVCIYKEMDVETKKYYYTVSTFFGFTLPVVGDLSTFRIYGETKSVEFQAKNDYWNISKLNGY